VQALLSPGGPADASSKLQPVKLAFYAAAAVALTVLGLWWQWALFWLVPYATWFQMTLRMRLMAEHLNLPESDWFQTRTILPGRFERWLLIPHQVHFHQEHHLYPGVPFYNLPALHRRLRAFGPFASRAVVRHGYLRVFREFTFPARSPAAPDLAE
jgi:fatty acid desaturase